MSFNYWIEKANAEAEAEARLKAEEEAELIILEREEVSSSEETSSSEDILNTVVTLGVEGLSGTSESTDKVDDTEANNAEVIYKGSKSAYICRIIFLDIPLGIPFLLIVLLLLGAGVAASTLLSILFAAACGASCIIGLVLLAYGFLNSIARAPLAVSCIGAGLVLTAVALLLLIPAILIGFKLVPWIASLYPSLCSKVGLFKRRVKR